MYPSAHSRSCFTLAALAALLLLTATLNANPLIRLNDAGQVLFLQGEDPTSLVIVSFGQAPVVMDRLNPGFPTEVLLVQGAPAPGFADWFVEGLSPFFDLNSAGTAAFKASFMDELGTKVGAALYTGSSAANLAVIAQTGQLLDGSLVSDVIPRLAINASDQVMFKAELIDDDDAGFFRYTPGLGVETMMRLGTDLFDDTLVTEIGGNANINALGSMLAKPTTTTGEERLYLLHGPTDRTEVARIGGEAPGGVYTDIGGSVHNDRNQVLFKAEVDAVGKLLLFEAHDPVIIAFSAPESGLNVISEIATVGQSVGADASIAEITNSFALNLAGQVAFTAELGGVPGVAGEDPIGIYFWSGDVLLEVTRSGDSLGDLTFVGTGSPVALNDFGSIFFIGNYQLGEHSVTGVYSWSESAGMAELLRTGDMLDERMITGIGAFNPVFDRHVNPSGLIAVEVFFDGDKSNPYVVVIPEPAVLHLAALGALVAGAYAARRRRRTAA